MKKNAESPATRRAEKNQSILILSIFSAIIMIVGIYWYFGQNIVWVPVTLLTALLIAAFYNPYVKKWTKGRNWIKFIVFLPILAGIASALSQIENYGDILVITFPILLISILVIKIIFIIINKKREKTKEEERSAQSHKELLIRETNERAIREARAQQALENIQSSKSAKWADILAVSYVYGPMKINHMEDVTVKIADTPIQELLIVSKIKKYITWNNQLIETLIILEQLTHLSYKDELLEKYILSMKIFLEYIEEYKDFTGYNSLQKVIKDSCKELLYLAGK